MVVRNSCAVSATSVSVLMAVQGSPGPPLEVSSAAFEPGGEIPAQYSCQGANLSPPLEWSGVPDGTQSLALVGAYLDDVGANGNQGSAYVFTRSATTWSVQQKLTALDGAVTDCFGSSVALSGDTALVGAYYDDVGTNTNQGSAYVFTRSGTTSSQQLQLTACDGAAQDLSLALRLRSRAIRPWWGVLG